MFPKESKEEHFHVLPKPRRVKTSPRPETLPYKVVHVAVVDRPNHIRAFLSLTPPLRTSLPEPGGQVGLLPNHVLGKVLNEAIAC